MDSNKVSMDDIEWYRLVAINIKDYVKYVINNYLKDVEDFLEEIYADNEDQIDFESFLDWINFEPGDFISNFPHLWAKVLEKCKDFEAEDVVSAIHWVGDEENLLSFAYDANEKFGDEVKKLLIKEGRWNEEDELEESCHIRRPRASRRPNRFLESRRINRNRR